MGKIKGSCYCYSNIQVNTLQFGGVVSSCGKHVQSQNGFAPLHQSNRYPSFEIKLFYPLVFYLSL